MIKQEAKEITEEIMSDVHMLDIGLEINDKFKIAKLIALKLKNATNEAVYQYVINNLNEKLI